MRVLAAVGLTMALAACSVGPQDRPAPVDDDAVPFGLLDADRAAPPAAPAPTSDDTLVFLVDDDDDLVGVPRSDATRSVDGLVNALRTPSSVQERSRGLRSPIGDSDPPLVEGATLEGGLATVDVAPLFTNLDAGTQRLAIAQVVLSFTSLPGVGQVSFTIAERPVDVPLADGSLDSGPLTRDDYDDLLAEP